jgi:hypothetical protein
MRFRWRLFHLNLQRVWCERLQSGRGNNVENVTISTSQNASSELAQTMDGGPKTFQEEILKIRKFNGACDRRLDTSCDSGPGPWKYLVRHRTAKANERHHVIGRANSSRVRQTGSADGGAPYNGQKPQQVSHASHVPQHCYPCYSRYSRYSHLSPSTV